MSYKIEVNPGSQETRIRDDKGMVVHYSRDTQTLRALFAMTLEEVATLRRERDEARVENERLRGIIRWGLSYADNNAPSPPDHLCGHPDACCDGNCADFATYQQWKAQAASAAKEGE